MLRLVSVVPTSRKKMRRRKLRPRAEVVLDTKARPSSIRVRSIPFDEFLIGLAVFLGLALSQAALGSLADRLAGFLSSILMSVLVFAVLFRLPMSGWSWHRALGSLLLLGAWIGAFASSLVWTGPVVWVIACIGIENLAESAGRWRLKALARGLGTTALVLLAIQLMLDGYYNFGWNWMQQASEWISSSIAPIRFRATASGLRLVLMVFVWLVVSSLFFRTRQAWQWIGLTGLALFSLYLAMLFSYRFFSPSHWHELLGPSARLYSQVPIPNPNLFVWFSAYDYVAIFGGIAAIVLTGLNYKLVSVYSNTSDSSKAHFPSSLAGGLAACLFLLLPYPQGVVSENTDPLRVGVYCAWDKSIPKGEGDRSIGLKYAGMYGMFVEDLKRRECEVRDLDIQIPLDDAILAELDSVVMLVRTNAVSDSEVEAIERFVANGGGLILVVDHTNLEGCQEVFDKIAKPFGVSANFDSAFSHRKWWHRNLQASLSSAWNAGSHDFGIGTGASLNVTNASRAMLVGKFAFGDLGNLFKSSRQEAFLGDYTYQHGEVLSDIIVATETEFGRGRVICVGDSSSFQNSVYPRAGRFVRHMIGWVGHRIDAPWWSMAPLVVGLVAMVLVAMWTGVRIGIGLAILMAVVVSLAWIQPHRELLPLNESTRAAVCLDIPESHINRDSFTDSSYQSLPFNLETHGLSAQWMSSVEESVKLNPKAIFLNAPVASLGRSRTQSLLDYLQRGGMLILTTDFSTSRAVKSFLAEAGLVLKDQPLGGDMSDPTEGSVRCVNAWGIETSSGSDIYVERYGVPIIVSKSVGAGRLVVVSDCGFFRDGNLESEDQGSRMNISFLKDLCSRIRNGPNGSEWKEKYLPRISADGSEVAQHDTAR